MEFSELDSDSEERPCRTRRLSDRNRRYLRAECFRVEKNLLIFGSVLNLLSVAHSFPLGHLLLQYNRLLMKWLFPNKGTKTKGNNQRPFSAIIFASQADGINIGAIKYGHMQVIYLRPMKCFVCVYRWGRWNDILNHGRFKWHLTERDMEVLCRALLVYCVRHYKGDDKIKSFIWDLITPTKDGHNQALQNHSGY